ncbi:MAG TPA: hypothetical protein VMZ71_13400 [Gemmataceae bacterium]|nr:hypothetical protein [Gemmataceae bacterium]
MGITSATLLFAFTLTSAADPPTAAEVEKAQAKVTEYLKKLPAGESARVTPLTGDGAAAFPNHILFSVVFPQYPVARIAPEPLKPANVFAAPKGDGKVVPASDAKQLEAMFKDHARPVKTAAEGTDAVSAWLRASAELSQDGFYKFTVKVDEKAASNEKGGYVGSGEAAVTPQGGNKGEVRATLTFKDGKLTKVEEKRNVIPGVRPICQATKLLDPDPIVRGMAEQSIRVMGSACRPYLDEQRAKASPELKQAIDRVWKQILAEGR